MNRLHHFLEPNVWTKARQLLARHIVTSLASHDEHVSFLPIIYLLPNSYGVGLSIPPSSDGD
jgi:hypothetical protein